MVLINMYNLTLKYNIRIIFHQFGLANDEHFYDTSEDVCLKLFEKMCLGLKQRPQEKYTMIELGSNQAYYSILFRAIIDGVGSNRLCQNILVEPKIEHIKRGVINFLYNDFAGIFVNRCIGNKRFDGNINEWIQDQNSISFTDLLANNNITNIDVLHCDIDGAEKMLLDENAEIFKSKIIKFIFLSTHDFANTHEYCRNRLFEYGYKMVFESVEQNCGSDNLLVFRA